MTTLREAAQQALQAMDYMLNNGEWYQAQERADALRTALEQPEQEPVADIPKEFNDWWDADRLTQTNPFREDSPAYWAWEGWQARAALAEPVEPVAWRWGYRSVTTGEMDWRGYVEIAAHPNLRSPAIIMEPLFTTPPQRKPLTESNDERTN
jgi:hypothetical protein